MAMKRTLTIRYFAHVLLLSLLIVYNPWAVRGQQKDGAMLKELFSSYHANALQEKLFVHTSKANFIAGETMYFKVNAVDAMTHKTSEISKVCYLELLSSSNTPVAQLKVSLQNGSGNGSLQLPDSLNSGNYRLIAYTSWMRNFHADFFFGKIITVLNPLEETTSTTAGAMQSVIRFFPEGGDMIANLPGRIAFQAVGANGEGIAFKGSLVDEKNDTILSFAPGKFGIGSFQLTPAKGKTYNAIIQTAAGNFTAPLPSARNEGMSIQLTNENQTELLVTVRSNESSLTDKDVFIFVHNRQRKQKVHKIHIGASGEAELKIPLNQLEEGISHFTLFDQQLRPRAQRLYFKQPVRVLNITVDQLNKSYTRRTPASISITASDEASKPAVADLSISIFKVDEIQSYDSIDIVNYFLLTSDLKGKIQNPSYYLGAGATDATAVDHLMLTHGWSRFRWEDILQSKYPEIRHTPEYEGHTIKAMVTDENENQISNAFMFLSVPSRRIQLYGAKSNAQGGVQFHTRDMFGKNEVVIQPLGQTASKYLYEFISPFTDLYPSSVVPLLRIHREHDDVIRSYSIHRQVESAFNAAISLRSVTPDSIPVFGIPDRSYLLSDYVKFPILKDVLREYIPEVLVRKKERKSNLFVLDKENQVYFESEPLVLLDGVPVFDTDRIIELPAQSFEKVEVITDKFYYGIFSFNGVVMFTTRNGLRDGTSVNPEAVVLDYEGMQVPLEYYSPVYNGIVKVSERLPDFRNVLLWNPNIRTDKNGRSNVVFSTSDLPGKYIGVIQGLTADGKPGAATFSFEVGSAK
jgi:hypothetical protein